MAAVAVVALEQRGSPQCPVRRRQVFARWVSYATFVASWFVELQPTEFLRAHAGFLRLAFLNESDFQNRYFHGPVRRFALDTPDPLWPLPRLFLGPKIPEQRQVLPRVPL